MIKIQLSDPNPTTVVIYSKRYRRDEISRTVQSAMPILRSFEEKSGAQLGSLPFCCYSDWTAGGVTVAVGFEVTGDLAADESVSTATILRHKYASAMHQGHFNELPATHAAVEEWIRSNGHESLDAVYEFFQTSPIDEPDPSEWKVKVAWELVD